MESLRKDAGGLYVYVGLFLQYVGLFLQYVGLFLQHLRKDAGGLYVLQAQLVAEGRVHEMCDAVAECGDVCALVAVFFFGA